MTIQEFVRDLYDADRNGTGKITLEDAEIDLKNFKADGWDMPEMTAEEYMEAWNALVAKA